MAAEGKGLDYQSAKIQLKVTKSALTKASSQFESAYKDLDKNIDAAQTKKVRLAASVMKNLENVNQRIKRMNDAHTILIDIIIGLEEDTLSKPKEELNQEVDGEHEKYIANIKDIKTGSEDTVS